MAANKSLKCSEVQISGKDSNVKYKLKLSLSLIKYHAMKTYEEVKV
jgi:hypothetical protein